MRGLIVAAILAAAAADVDDGGVPQMSTNRPNTVYGTPIYGLPAYTPRDGGGDTSTLSGAGPTVGTGPDVGNGPDVTAGPQVGPPDLAEPPDAGIR